MGSVSKKRAIAAVKNWKISSGKPDDDASNSLNTSRIETSQLHINGVSAEKQVPVKVSSFSAKVTPRQTAKRHASFIGYISDPDEGKRLSAEFHDRKSRE